MDPELTQMMQRYEELYRIMLVFGEHPELPWDKEKSMERALLYHTLRSRGYILDTRTTPWQWLTKEEWEKEENQ